MKYLPPFDKIRGQMTLATVRGVVTASASYAEFQSVIRTLLAGIEVDEDWYLEQNPDIADAIKAGIVRSAKQHFVYDGYFEGRRPFPIRVDEAFYLAQYPEVAEAIREGRLESAQQHFDENGYREGRLPYRM